MTARKVIGCKRPDGGADCLVEFGCSGCPNAIYEEPRGLRKLISALQAELEKNGDAEHVAVSLSLSNGTEARRIDIHSQIDVLSDWANYPNGFVYLVADSDLQIEQQATPPAHGCNTSHYLACDCREHKVAVLIKAALDLAVESEHLKNDVPLDEEKKELIQDNVNRVHDAIEQLGWSAELSLAAAKPCQHVVVVADECAKCGCEVTA